MPQLFPDGVNAINLNRAQTQPTEPIVVPEEPSFDTPALQGSMQQILSENLGQYVTVDFTMGTNTFQRRTGILYAVGRSFLVLYNERYQAFSVIDMFSVKTVSFYGTTRPAWMDQIDISGNVGILGDGSGLIGGVNAGEPVVMSQPQNNPIPNQNRSRPSNYRSMSNR